MIVRDDMAAAFRDASLRNFEERALHHVREKLPRQSAPFSDTQIRVRVRDCIRRCERYEFVSERQIVCYLDTTFLLVEYFDTDPRFGWSATILTSRKLSRDDASKVLLAVAYSVSNGEPSPA